ncbi:MULTISPECIES: exodeoxyribonuclease VII small subunit [unclassified Rhodococcus (in: high G+C Gram-positive bacteria)]|uniref:exodeoxyribonuclease VII small subunit n=1 Tax=unclassified Rhodococcus (in: high G+C Gram-positive bacteria) TaxID=192944 RepID=UPI00146C8111|nr:exodeoxyribonuclease VII small subunit [Rhodococcus sp. BL-253-APC-6A1W]NME79989.1 exodeoxyribonuclease VII small subunit [Rhodococcus sp. 105337]
MTNTRTEARTVDDANADVREFGYERARDELVGVVKMLEQGGLDLDESLQLWERGEALAKRCEEHLAGARERVESALAHADDLDSDEDADEYDEE